MQLLILRHVDQTLPVLFPWHTQNLHDLAHLIPLKRDGFLTIHLCFFSLEDWPEVEEFREDTTDCPEIGGRGIVAGSEEEVWAAIPDRHDDFIARVEGGQWVVEETG